MQHLIAKTGLGVSIAHVIKELELEKDKDAIKSMLIQIFTNRFDQFRKRHSSKFAPTSLVAYYIVQNEYPVGENDIHQYFRALANEVKISNGSLSIGPKEERKNFTVIEGYSRNDNYKKKQYAKLVSTENNNKECLREANMNQAGRTQRKKRPASNDLKEYSKPKKQLHKKKLV